MRIIFAGTPEFAASALAALIEAGYQIPLVLTQPDRPAGRGMQLQPSPVKQLALKHDITVLQPTSLKQDVPAREMIDSVKADVMIVAAYGLILPQAVLDMPRLGCLNIHASLLPRWRGAAPIHRAILAGDSETGICIMQMEAGLDTGPVLAHARTTITRTDTTGSLHNRLAQMGATLIVDTLAALPLTATAQPETGITYAAKIEKSEAQLDWQLSAEELDRHIRAFNPFPAAQTSLQGATIKIWSAHPVDGEGKPGTVLSVSKQGIHVACGKGALCITELQKAGGKRLAITHFLAGHSIKPNETFGQ